MTGPTVSSFDAVMRVDENGAPAFSIAAWDDRRGLPSTVTANLYVAASLSAASIVRISPDGAKEITLAG